MNSPTISADMTDSATTIVQALSSDAQPHATLDRPTDVAVRRAVVLHGGGAAGNAWEIGVIAGLYAAGLDVTRADLIIGTSAGATAAAQITSDRRPPELFSDIVDATSDRPPRAPQSSAIQVPLRPAVDYMEVSSAIIAAATDALDMRRRIGAAARELDARSDGSGQIRWRAIVAARLPSQHWPEQEVFITAVDADSGEPVVFDRRSGVDLVDAVAASCAIGFGVPPYTIGEHHYIDGGYRRNENADLAAGYERVVVLSPLGGRTRHPLEWGMQLAAQIEELLAGGSRVEAVFPDSRSLEAFGFNMMDPSTRPSSARAGYDQGVAAAPRLSELWR